MKTGKSLVLSLVFLLFSIISTQACRIAPLPVNNVMYPIETRRHDVNISIRNHTADITVNAVFYNPNNVQLEGDYWFPLYDDAAVSSFTMLINGREMKAELLDSDKARAVYEEIVRRVKDPALLEYAGTRMLRQRVFPILPRSEVSLILKYTQDLKQSNGSVKLMYPLSSAKPDRNTIGDVRIRVKIEEQNGVRNVYAPGFLLNTDDKDSRYVESEFSASNYMPDKPFTLYYTPLSGEVNASLMTHKTDNEDGFFTLVLSPSAGDEGSASIPKDMVFVIDHSGSMQGEKLDKAKEALLFCLDTLRPKDRFNIVAFSSGTEICGRGMMDAGSDGLYRARRFARNIESDGGTNINEALELALKQFRDSGKNRMKAVIFLTDGLPTEGETETGRILSNIRSRNKEDVRIFVFGAGADVNTELLDKIASDNGGECEYVINPGESIEKSISALATRISAPVLSDIRVEFDGINVYDTFPKKLPDMFKGGSVNITGRFSGYGKARITLIGRTSEGRKDFRYSVDFDRDSRDASIMKLWASKKVAYLMDEINLHGRNKSIEEQIKSIGKKYGIVTPYTSFLIVEDSMRNMLTGGKDEEVIAREMAESKTGDFAVQRSKGIAKMKKAEAAPSLMMPAAAPAGSGYDEAEVSEKLEATIKNAGGRAFVLTHDGYFTDTEFDAKNDRAKEIRYLSREYFEMSKEGRDVTEILSLGVKVIFKYKGSFYKVTE